MIIIIAIQILWKTSENMNFHYSVKYFGKIKEYEYEELVWKQEQSEEEMP